VRNTDVVAAIDDAQCLALMRLFNEPVGQEFLLRRGVPERCVSSLPLIGISSICNLVAAIKTARMFDLTGRDVLLTPLTDSMALYASRLEEQGQLHGPYDAVTAVRHFGRYLEGIVPDHLRELTYADRKRLHNFKYYTWVEQQQRTVEELNRLWDPDFWLETFSQAAEWDRLIEEFNRRAAVV
jgi:hypothetical protein